MNNRHDLFGVFHGQTHHNDIITIKPKCAEIKGTIKGFIADLKITQTIMNDSGFFIKNLSYDFPTDNNLCIYKIYFIVGQEKIVAQLKEKKIAQKIYKEAKESGITVFRNESHSYGKNKIKLGNIDAQKQCKIIIRCAFEAKLINLNEISFKFPFRKIHSEYKMELDLKICEQQPIKSIFMNGKKINCNCSIFNNNATLKIDNIKSFQDSIFLTIHMKNSIESLLTCSNDTIVVSFIPPPKPLTNEAFINENQEIIFLIDCGFSMRQMISPIKKCLLNCINNYLPNSIRINILRFSDTYEFMSPTALCIQDHKKYIKNYINTIDSEMEETNMIDPFIEIYRQKMLNQSKKHKLTNLVLISDGITCDSSNISELVHQNQNFYRLFSIEIGTGTDLGLLDDISKITCGKSIFLSKEEAFQTKNKLDSAFQNIIDLIMMECLTDIEIFIDQIESFEISSFPFPKILPSNVYNIFIYLAENELINRFEKESICANIIGKYSYSKKEISIILESNNESKCDSFWNSKCLFSLFAFHQLKNMKKDKQQSIELSLRSGVQCDYTTFIGVSTTSIQDHEILNFMRILAEDRMMIQRIDDNLSQIGSESTVNNRLSLPNYEKEEYHESDSDEYIVIEKVSPKIEKKRISRFFLLLSALIILICLILISSSR